MYLFSHHYFLSYGDLRKGEVIWDWEKQKQKSVKDQTER